MTDQLLDHARHYADAHAGRDGIAVTPFKGLVILRETAPSMLEYAISKPLVALVLQGRKRVMMGRRPFDFGAGESLLITTDVPTVSQITSASRILPYYSLVLELDPATIGDLVDQIGATPLRANQPVRVDETEAEIADAALRLLRLCDRPDTLAVLGQQLSRELHYWLLSGRHGGSIRQLGVTDSHAQRIARAVTLLRNHYAEPVRIAALAETAGMSLSAFHVHFRNITSLTPLQFQKQLRLIEARRRMLARGEAISDAAYGVGYESVPQFTREYGRLFGQPPARDIRLARERMTAAA
ncbi:AraC family transcriptional regulator [Roseospira marina]|uniref:AraC family transcriptional regulator n=1 Tax=Roseospira marina TaxID=140057 RepID=A0A5M6IF63_9PROT|nr:AraC family transcriptional regulator [Roseospira marina]KAA5606389.1 AraC family transcriptional regulator [Roseospira marina]MBB4314204.1 AraC-like DNA-binding protein [Roseospira marina]MBB5087365.1 AraC-like DNA-binding protein [Roseospira marina]